MLGQVFSVTFLSKKVMRLEFWQVYSPPLITRLVQSFSGLNLMSDPCLIVFIVLPPVLSSILCCFWLLGTEGECKWVCRWGQPDVFKLPVCTIDHMALDRQCSLQLWCLPMPFPYLLKALPFWSHLHTQLTDSWALDDEKLNGKCQVKFVSNPVSPHGHWDVAPKISQIPPLSGWPYRASSIGTIGCQHFLSQSFGHLFRGNDNHLGTSVKRACM